MAGCTVFTIVKPGYIMAGPFFAIFAVGFFYVSILSLRARRAPAAGAVGEPSPAAVKADPPADP